MIDFDDFGDWLDIVDEAAAATSAHDDDEVAEDPPGVQVLQLGDMAGDEVEQRGSLDDLEADEEVR